MGLQPPLGFRLARCGSLSFEANLVSASFEEHASRTIRPAPFLRHRHVEVGCANRFYACQCGARFSGTQYRRCACASRPHSTTLHPRVVSTGSSHSIRTPLLHRVQQPGGQLWQQDRARGQAASVGCLLHSQRAEEVQPRSSIVRSSIVSPPNQTRAGVGFHTRNAESCIRDCTRLLALRVARRCRLFRKVVPWFLKAARSLLLMASGGPCWWHPKVNVSRAARLTGRRPFGSRATGPASRPSGPCRRGPRRARTSRGGRWVRRRVR